jgi:hypothetical protein
VKVIPINRMVPRSFITNIASGAKMNAAAPTRCAASHSVAIAASPASISPSTAAKAGIKRNWERMKANMDFASGRRN